MINVPQYVQDALIAPDRKITSKVKMTKKNGEEYNLTPVLIGYDIERTVSEMKNSVPYGQITYDSCTIDLDNLDKMFIKDNPESVLYGELVAGLPMEIIATVTTEQGEYDISLGTFYTDEWSATIESNKATVTCYDKLYIIGQREFTNKQVYKNITATRAFQEIFRLMGLDESDYSIDAGLSTTFDYWWPEGNLAVDVLQKLAEICGANIYMHRNNIKVTPVWKDTPAVFTLNDSNVVIGTKAEPSYKEVYSDISINYQRLNGITVENVYRSSAEIKLAPRQIYKGSFKLSAAPIESIVAVILTHGNLIEIQKVTSFIDTCYIEIFNNSNKEYVGELMVYGKVLDTVEDRYVTENISEANNQLEISTPYVLSEKEITRLSSTLKNLYKGTLTNLTINIRALPILELYDRITLDSDRVRIHDDYYITEITYDCFNGFMGTLKLSATAKSVPQKYIFVSPGLIINKKGV